MLNLHNVIASSLKLEREFQDLVRKYRGDYIYGRKFITETALDITETLEMVIFHLNALTGGRDIHLFGFSDNLKTRINRCFDKSQPGSSAASVARDAHETEDAVSALLRKIIDNTVGAGFFDGRSPSTKIEDEATALGLLNRCYDRIYSILDTRLQSISSANSDEAVRKTPIFGISTGYLLQDEKPRFEAVFPGSENPESHNSNSGLLRLVEGIFEVSDSTVYGSFVEPLPDGTGISGMAIYSNEALVLYYCPGRFKNIVTANVCDDVGGNHIDLLIGSADRRSEQPSSHRLVLKLLEWLDFHTFEESGFTVASIRNMTRGDTENHLNILGKLLLFVSSTRIEPSDDDSVQRNIDMFLEHVA